MTLMSPQAAQSSDRESMQWFNSAATWHTWELQSQQSVCNYFERFFKYVHLFKVGIKGLLVFR